MIADRGLFRSGRIGSGHVRYRPAVAPAEPALATAEKATANRSAEYRSAVGAHKAPATCPCCPVAVRAHCLSETAPVRRHMAGDSHKEPDRWAPASRRPARSGRPDRRTVRSAHSVAARPARLTGIRNDAGRAHLFRVAERTALRQYGNLQRKIGPAHAGALDRTDANDAGALLHRAAGKAFHFGVVPPCLTFGGEETAAATREDTEDTERTEGNAAGNRPTYSPHHRPRMRWS